MKSLKRDGTKKTEMEHKNYRGGRGKTNHLQP